MTAVAPFAGAWIETADIFALVLRNHIVPVAGSVLRANSAGQLVARLKVCFMREVSPSRSPRWKPRRPHWGIATPANR